MSAFSDNTDIIYYIIGMLNTPLGNSILKILNPTINSQIGDFQNIPIILEDNHELVKLVKDAVSISKVDWNSSEIAWDFTKNPII